MNKPIFSLVLPTYNEKENIMILIPELIKNFNNYNIEIIIVDDGSTDGTLEEIKKMQINLPNILLINRNKLLGIGSALIAGYNSAKGKYIISCDSDLSFPVEDVKKIGNALISDDYDLVLGSRHIRGAYYEAPNFEILKKKIISRIGNIFLRIVNSIPVHDFSANCRGIKSSAWGKINLKSNNNSMLFEMIWQANSLGFKIKEVPVRFFNRKFGNSKLKLEKEVIKALIQFLKLKFSSFF